MLHEYSEYDRRTEICCHVKMFPGANNCAITAVLSVVFKTQHSLNTIQLSKKEESPVVVATIQRTIKPEVSVAVL